ncbi:MAG TPA: MFS transporter [Candidatus Nitrosocosmicus sp.]|nr:MFS transporter [Candidatus Nitrosocosmicus sp.]
MLTSGERSLLKIQTIYIFSNSIVGIFLQVYIFKLTGFNGVVIYNLCSFITLLLFYILSGFFLKTYSTSHLIRVSLLLTILNYVLIFFLQKSATSFIIPLGLMSGIAAGLYWSAFNLSQYIITHSKSRNNYFGKGLSFMNIAIAAGPFIGGSIITLAQSFTGYIYTGYNILFVLVILIYLFLFYLSKKLPEHSGIEFSFKDLFLKEKSTKWKLVLGQNFILGLWDIPFTTLNTILLFIIIQQEYTLGIVRTGIFMLTAIISFFAGKFISKYKSAFIIGCVGTSLSIILFALNQNWLGVILFGLINGIFSPFFSVPTSSIILDTIDENKESWRKKYHMFLERDGALGIARVIGYTVLFILFSIFDKDMIAKNWMIIISIFPLMIGFLLYKSYKQ